MAASVTRLWSRAGTDHGIFRRMSFRARHVVGFCASVLVGTLACARASAPLPPAEEVVLVVNKGAATLQVIPVDAPGSSTTIPLGGTSPTPTGVSALNGRALVPLGADNSVAVVDLQSRQVTRVIPLAPNSGATGSAIVDDSTGYVANPNLNTVTQVNYLTGDTASVAVGIYPQAVAFTRGKVFVLNGNLVNGQVAGPSWISVVDPITNRLAGGTDSIPLPGPGNAIAGAVGPDGLLYVMNMGPDTGVEGRLSEVDPVGFDELANFGGFGFGPGAIATNGINQLYVSSLTEGLMVFDITRQRVTRGAGNGLAIPHNSGVAVDSRQQVYALDAGDCASTPGTVHILRTDLSEIRTITAGLCAVAALVTEVPPSSP
ncbi:MAG TPA: hypothetical protein VMG41_16310 [Gemmatimonadales bacterium]|nr:hypothetical protein [Gemmatimonadales bacterium]